MLLVEGQVAALGRARDVVRAYYEYLRERGLIPRIETSATG
jgi:hypothetical protein